MFWLLFVLGLVLALGGPALLYSLSRTGRRLREEARRPRREPASWPSVGLIIPCAGTHPDMRDALTSLLEQNYPGSLRVCLVTATADEPAARLVDALAQEHTLEHVVAGPASGMGQKNHNLLAGVRALDGRVEVYAFCDSTHLASPDFVSRLVEPLASGEAEFSTGYHEVVPRDTELVTLAYTFCVLAMRLMQALPGFTQAWGGAMAMRASAFVRHRVAEFWSDKVVDDCSLSGELAANNVRIQLCPAALLRTRAAHHSSEVWKAWLERQILFLRFCIRPQWYLLGALLVFVAAIPTLAFLLALGWLVGLLPFAAGCLAGVYVAATAFSLCALRRYLPHHVPLMRLLGAFWLTCFSACSTFCKTMGASGILWHGNWYEVGPMGTVISRTPRP